MKYAFWCASFLGLAVSMPANAQETCAMPGGDGDAQTICVRVLQPIEVTGFRPGDLETVPASVTRLGSDDLAIRNAPNPADALRAVPGVAVSRSGGAGALTQVRIRGAEANHTLVLFDGIDVSDPVTGETDFGLLTALPGLSIDVLRGAASSIHGTDAIGGVVSISSSPNGTGLFASAEGGSFDTAQSRLSAIGETVSGAVGAYTTGGIDTSGLGGETDGSEVYSGLVKGRTNVSGWTLSGLALARRSTAEIDTDADFDGRLENADAETEARQWLAGAGLDGKTGAVDHRVRASFNEVTRENLLAGNSQDTSTGQRTHVSWSPSLDQHNRQFSGLVSFRRETYDREDSQFDGFTNASESFEAVSLAAQYKRHYEILSLDASLRHDLNGGRFDDATTWRLGASHQFRSQSAQLRASIATGVKNPTFTELYGFFPGSFIGNPSLKPETALSAEFGWDQHLAFPHIHYSVTAFAANLDKEIFTSFNPNFTATALNRQEDSQRRGLEFAARWAPSEVWSFKGQVSGIVSENDSNEDEIRVPSVTASLSSQWTPRERMNIGLALDYTGEQDDLDFGAFPAARVTLDDYVLVSATAAWPLTDRVSATLRADNLLDESARDVFGYATPGAGFYVGLKLQ